MCCFEIISHLRLLLMFKHKLLLMTYNGHVEFNSFTKIWGWRVGGIQLLSAVKLKQKGPRFQPDKQCLYCQYSRQVHSDMGIGVSPLAHLLYGMSMCNTWPAIDCKTLKQTMPINATLKVLYFQLYFLKLLSDFLH